MISVVIRKLLSDSLSADRELEVVGVGQRRELRWQKLAAQPDLLTLDIEMPVWTADDPGEVRKLYPKLPVIMSARSASMERRRHWMHSRWRFRLRASRNTGGPQVGLERVLNELIRKIKALCGNAPVKLLPLPESHPASKGRS